MDHTGDEQAVVTDAVGFGRLDRAEAAVLLEIGDSTVERLWIGGVPPLNQHVLLRLQLLGAASERCDLVPTFEGRPALELVDRLLPEPTHSRG